MNIRMANEAREEAAKLSEAQRRSLKRSGKKLFLREERREGWSGSLPFYLFWCAECEHWAKDYPHSYPERRYLSCPSCSAYHSFIPRWIFWKELFNGVRFFFKILFARRRRKA